MGDRVDEVLEIELSNGDGVLELDILGTLRNCFERRTLPVIPRMSTATFPTNPF